MATIPGTMFQHPLVGEADLIACSKITADIAQAQAMLSELGGQANGRTLLSRISKFRKLPVVSVISQFVRPGLSQVISSSAIQTGNEDVFLVDGLPMIPVHITRYGVITAITPVVCLDKTAALEKLKTAYGCLRAHLLLVPPDHFEALFIKMTEGQRLRETPAGIPVKTPGYYWDYLVSIKAATGALPTTEKELAIAVRAACKGSADPDKLLIAASLSQGYPIIRFNQGDIFDRMPHFSARVQKIHVLTPISLVGKVCTIATPRPPTQEDRSVLSGFEEKFCYVLAERQQVERAITEWEAHSVSAHAIAQRITVDTSIAEEIRIEEINIETLASVPLEGESQTVVELVQAILLYAIRNNATDIHISQQPEHMMVRFRIDGFLCSYPSVLGAHLTKAAIARIKVLSDIDTQHSPIPLDGKFAMRVRDQEFDVRVATTLTAYGEKAVLRLLSKDKRLPTLEELGFQEFEKSIVERLNNSDHGMLVLCGPTGSGKSTTMAATIGMIDRQKYAVVTGEQPIERQILDIDQTHVTSTPTNPNGLTFARFVEAALRQDPDYIIIGETRDSETAKQAVRAAMTGHIVLTTLHTNSAPAAPGRLIDLGVEPFLLQESLKAVCAQRLLPRLCQHCAVPLPEAPNEQALTAMGMKPEWFDDNVSFMSAEGCPLCRNSGYSGRTAIIEGYWVTREIRRIIGKEQASSERILHEMISQGGRSLYMQAALLAAKGVTDLTMAVQIRSDD